ncbi:MAG: hypothetical protein KIT34_10470 [Cyanobacteria bacterium TGS_CYA1]|nr:hypothetical protein [Cyanobacteria bacterium TGS_CYA1]
MDVGFTVGNVSFLTSFFAALAFSALIVELGDRAVERPDDAGQNKGKSKAKKANLEATMLTSSATPSAQAAREKSKLDDMKDRFVDGFTSNRNKYDMALTILFKSPEEKFTASNTNWQTAKEAYRKALALTWKEVQAKNLQEESATKGKG